KGSLSGCPSLSWAAVWWCLSGLLICRWFQNFAALFCMSRRSGYLPNSALHAMLVQLLFTHSIFLQNSKWNSSGWLLSHVSNLFLNLVPQTSLPYSNIGFSIESKSFSQSFMGGLYFSSDFLSM